MTSDYDSSDSPSSCELGENASLGGHVTNAAIIRDSETRRRCQSDGGQEILFAADDAEAGEECVRETTPQTVVFDIDSELVNILFYG